MADQSTLQERLKSFSDLVEIQCSPGNWNYDAYMHGMANGMRLAQAHMNGETPEYLEAPDAWLSDVRVEPEIVSEG